MRQLQVGIVVAATLLAACDRAPDARPATPASTTQPDSTETSAVRSEIAEKLRARVGDFYFRVAYWQTETPVPVTVFLSVSLPPADPERMGPAVRISEAEARRLIDWLDADGMLARGKANRKQLLRRPGLPYFSLAAGLSPYDAYLDQFPDTDAARARLERLADVLDADVRQRVHELLRPTATTSPTTRPTGGPSRR